MKLNAKLFMAGLLIVAVPLILGGCGDSSGTGATPTGVANMDVTDAPAMDYSHVYVTVTGIAFHTDTTASFSDYSSGRTSGWQVTRLTTPKTVDLAQLANGTMYAGTNGGTSLFSGMVLPVGTYRQIRIFLASTEDGLTASANALGLTYNNEVQLNGDGSHYPLRIPTADEGIRLIPEAPVVVTSGGSANLALDFNLNNDVVAVSPNGVKEFILKPQLGYFDLNSVGAVKGVVSFSNLSTSRFVIKAEQVKSGVNYRVVRRWTTVDRNSGAFTLYPLPIFNNATTATYDILLRGRNAETAIVKGVRIHKGSTPTGGAVDLGTIPIQPGSEFTAQLASAMHPTGAWLNFYQKLTGDPIPYEVRYRHLDPYTGTFHNAIELSTGPIHVATYTPGQALSFAPDATSQGIFSVVSNAGGYFGPGAELSGLTGAAGQIGVPITMAAANYPQVSSPATPAQITAIFDMSFFGRGLGHGMGMGTHITNYPNKGQIFVTHGGLIIDSVGTLSGDTMVGDAMYAGGGAGNPVVIANLPGGVSGTVYGLYALGWGNGVLAAGRDPGVNLKNGNTTSTIRMW